MSKTILQEQILPPIAKPSFDSTMERWKSNIFYSLNCHRVGVIEDFNPENQTATIQLVDTFNVPTFNGTLSEPYAPLVNVPVHVAKGKGGGFTRPIRKGDECSVLINDRDLDKWQVYSGINVPATIRAHQLTDAIAIVGLHSYPNSVADYDNEATVIDYIDETGAVQGSISVAEKIEFKNATQNLKTLVDSLINTIKTLKTVNGASQYPIDAATSASLDTLLINFDALLK